MEKFRVFLDKLFWVVAIAAVIALIVLSLGGAFPVSLSMTEHKAIFDITTWGWSPVLPDNGELSVTHEEEDVHTGWGSLMFTYRAGGAGSPGFYSTSYPIEGFSIIEFYMKAEHPGHWDVQIRRKTDQKVYRSSVFVDKDWTYCKIGLSQFSASGGFGSEKIKDKLDFEPWIQFVDVTSRGYSENTVWMDELIIRK